MTANEPGPRVAQGNVDLINHPPHYTAIPLGFNAECIEYARHMTYPQGAAFKYLYRAGSKGDLLEDLGKCVWYVVDALHHELYRSVAHLTPSVHPTLTTRSRIGHMILHGQLNAVLPVLRSAPGRLDALRAEPQVNPGEES